MKYAVELRTTEGKTIQVPNLKEIRDNSSTYTEVNFNEFMLYKTYSYTFIGENEIFSIEGENLNHAQILKINA